MEPEAERLIVESLDQEHVDKDEYPQTAELEGRCVNMLADLYHAPPTPRRSGPPTIGSSEACMLGGLAAKWRWRGAAAAGKPSDRPNLVMAANVQVVWEKFARYWDVEPRFVPVGRPHDARGREAIRFVDENTIGVVAILGSTYTGEYEPIAAIHDAVRAEVTTGTARTCRSTSMRPAAASSRRSSTRI